MPLKTKQITNLETELSSKISGGVVGLTNSVAFFTGDKTIGGSASFVHVDGLVGIGTTDPGFTLEVNGTIAATDKSFIINHPTKQGMKLRHGSLEGPENAVYVRGRLEKGEKIINLPDYWTGLVNLDTITIQLTGIGNVNCYVEEIDLDNLQIKVNSSGLFSKVNCFYLVLAERKDIDKMTVEFDA